MEKPRKTEETKARAWGTIVISLWMLCGAVFCSPAEASKDCSWYKRLWSGYRRVRQEGKVLVGTSLKGISPSALALFDRLHRGQLRPENLTPSERAALEDEGLYPLFLRHLQASYFIKTLNLYRALWARSTAGPLHTLTMGDVRTWGGNARLLPVRLRRVFLAESYATALRNPDHSFSKKELSHAASLGLAKDLERFQAQAHEGSLPEQKAGLRQSSELRSFWLKEAGQVPVEATRMTLDASYNFLRFLFPIPRFISRYGLGLLYEKGKNDPHYQAKKGWFGENAMLKRFHLTEDFERFKQDYARFGARLAPLAQTRSVGNYVLWSLVAAASGAVVLGHRWITSDESLEEGLGRDSEGKSPWERPDFAGMSRYDEKVELIYNVPWSHVYLRVGGMVYNYGELVVEAFPLTQLKARLSNAEGSVLSHVRVELNLDETQKEDLQQAIEKDVGKNYIILFPYNDCNGQVSAKLARTAGICVPPIANRSQAGSIAYFKMIKLLGSDRVGQVTFATRKGQHSLEAAKHASVSALDSALFLSHWGKMLITTPLIDRYLKPFEFPSLAGDRPEDP